MQPITRELQTLWWDWLGTSERLLRSLHEQTAALTLRDVARVERIQPELDALIERMRVIDSQASASARRVSEELGTESNLRSLVGALAKDESMQVQSIANRVTVVARNVQNVMEKNQKLVDNELTYVGGTLALIAKASSDKQGAFGASSRAAVVLDQVA